MATTRNNKSRLEIGILEDCDSFLLESRFFPSKFGGKPAWLDLLNLPKTLTCGVCFDPCIFLCQLYAPIDDKPECHHRTIFVFICPNPKCCKPNENKNLKVFRCQLPARNDFYPIEDPIEEEDWHPECQVSVYSKVCSLCGNPAPYTCGKCKSTSYCTKEHQVSDWKIFGHKINCGKETLEKAIEPSLLFPELEISIETIDEDDLPQKKTEAELMSEYEELAKNGKIGTLSEVESKSIEEFAEKLEDKYFLKYKTTIQKYSQQVLRYDRGGTPLFIAKPAFTEKDVPSCDYCGGERQFEFQILSTLLNEFMDNERWNGIDWGSLLIYTCKSSCMRGPSYKAEYVYKQDIG